MSKQIVAVVIHLDDGGDLRKREFADEEDAKEFLEEMEWKACLITGSDLKVVDRT